MKTVVAAAIGECVHVAGITHFLRLAEQAGWHPVFLGPAVSIDELLAAAERENAQLIGISYRLTPETGERLLGELAEAADHLREKGVHFVFGGTPPVAERASKLGFFDGVFDGSQPAEELLAYLKGESYTAEDSLSYPTTTIARIKWKSPYPILRHHFGLPDYDATVKGIEKIAEARVIDAISLGVDQETQENFFHPERQNPRRRGAGGVPVRSIQEFRDLYQASQRGNFPLLRTYSGTDDFIRMAEVFVETIHNAWCAIPLFWFNQMDGRGPWDMAGSIREHQKVMAWYGERNIPVELNEPHHWGMRDSSDVVFVVSAFLSAYNARAFGVKDYIAQMMFNSPPGLSDQMDLAKMLAILEMIEQLRTPDFRIWKQARTGLLSYPLNLAEARAHLATSIYLQMSLRPHIIHIVGFTEADHAATADEVIEAGHMARRAIENALSTQPDMLQDQAVIARKDYLIEEANTTLNAIRALSENLEKDPLTDPVVLTRAVTIGIMDAPQLKNNPYGQGIARTNIINGASEAVDRFGNAVNELERIHMLDLKE